jgi:hypothetical protein
MARKRRDKDQVPGDNQAGKTSEAMETSPEPEPEVAAQEPRSRRGRKLFFLLALAGTATYLVRRSQRRAQLDEGIWHEAPAPPAHPSPSGATGSTGSPAPASPPTTV